MQLLDRKADPLKPVSYGLHVNHAFTMQSFSSFCREEQHQQGMLNVRDSNGDLFDLRVAEDFSMILVITET